MALSGRKRIVEVLVLEVKRIGKARGTVEQVTCQSRVLGKQTTCLVVE